QTRPEGLPTLTRADDDFYSMDHPRRGDCIIFSYSDFSPNQRLSSRSSAAEDTRLCAQAFMKLGFEVEVHENLTTEKLKKVLEEVKKRDHNPCDALVVVYMSHGEEKNGKEFLCTYDSKVPTKTLWESFLGDQCTSLAGKPKLFFIQACRGEKTDKGIGMKVYTDSASTKTEQNEYVVPVHADILVMWGSFEGLYSFRTSREGINGSVFVHFLAHTLMEEGTKVHLLELLIKVTRRVALEFESRVNRSELDHNKQVPHISSTLIRKVYFPEP
ncbi:Caspase-like domain, partial [Trinorchestia longiramus]